MRRHPPQLESLAACLWGALAAFLVVWHAGAIVQAADPQAITVSDDPVESVPVFAEEPCPAPAGKLPASECFPRFVAGADYLLLRPSFSNSTAMYEATATAGRNAVQSLNYDFGYASGVRGFLGYNFSADTMGRFSYLGFGATTTVSGTASGNYGGGDGTAYFGPFLTQAIPANA